MSSTPVRWSPTSPSATVKWAAEKAAMAHLGYKVVYDPTFDITTTDFNQYVVTMKNAGVKILFLEQMPANYAAAVVKALNQQNFHPVLVLGRLHLQRGAGARLGRGGSHRRRLHGAEHSALPGGGRSRPPGRQDLPDLGAEGVARASMPTCTRCTAGCRPSCSARPSRRPAPTPAGARCSRRSARSPRFRREPGGHGQPGRQDPDQLLHHRHHRQREVQAAGRPAAQRADPRLPVRSALLLLPGG